jgi:hypothetical protein
MICYCIFVASSLLLLLQCCSTPAQCCSATAATAAAENAAAISTAISAGSLQLPLPQQLGRGREEAEAAALHDCCSRSCHASSRYISLALFQVFIHRLA